MLSCTSRVQHTNVKPAPSVQLKFKGQSTPHVNSHMSHLGMQFYMLPMDSESEETDKS